MRPGKREKEKIRQWLTDCTALALTCHSQWHHNWRSWHFWRISQGSKCTFHCFLFHHHHHCRRNVLPFARLQSYIFICNSIPPLLQLPFTFLPFRRAEAVRSREWRNGKPLGDVVCGQQQLWNMIHHVQPQQYRECRSFYTFPKWHCKVQLNCGLGEIWAVKAVSSSVAVLLLQNGTASFSSSYCFSSPFQYRCYVHCVIRAWESRRRKVVFAVNVFIVLCEYTAHTDTNELLIAVSTAISELIVHLSLSFQCVFMDQLMVPRFLALVPDKCHDLPIWTTFGNGQQQLPAPFPAQKHHSNHRH